VNARPKIEAPHPEDLALDALARALAPRVLDLLRRQASANDGDRALAELLESAGFELDRSDP
jgi:hypothetical protein